MRAGTGGVARAAWRGRRVAWRGWRGCGCGYFRSLTPGFDLVLVPEVAVGEVVRLGIGLGDLAGPAFGVAAGLLEVPDPVGLPGPFELPEELPLDPPEELAEPLEPPEELPEERELEAFGAMPTQVGLGDAAGVLLGDAVAVGLGLCDALVVGLGLVDALVVGLGLAVRLGLLLAVALLVALDDALLDALADREAGAELDALPGVQVGDGLASDAALVAVPLTGWRRSPALVPEVLPGTGTTAPGPCPALPLPPAVPPALPVGWPDRTDELSWTIAWRSGGTAAATPAANTAQAIASAGRSSMLTSQRRW